MGFFKKTAKDDYLNACKRIRKLRDDRSKLKPDDPNFDKKNKKLISKISEQNDRKKVAEIQLRHPSRQNNRKTYRISKTTNNNSLEAHGHLHLPPITLFSRKRKKK